MPPKTARMCVTALTMSPVPASPLVRIIAAPSEIRRSASPRFVQPHITGIVTASWISRILSGSAIRATPPSARMSAGTRSSAITATAPASSAIRACSAVVTSMITPPLSISARPLLTRIVPVSAIAMILALDISLPAAGALAGGGRGGRRANEGAPAGDRLLRGLVARGLHARRDQGAAPAREGLSPPGPGVGNGEGGGVRGAPRRARAARGGRADAGRRGRDRGHVGGRDQRHLP